MATLRNDHELASGAGAAIGGAARRLSMET
jgi:hypothetical protein